MIPLTARERDARVSATGYKMNPMYAPHVFLVISLNARRFESLKKMLSMILFLVRQEQ